VHKADNNLKHSSTVDRIGNEHVSHLSTGTGPRSRGRRLLFSVIPGMGGYSRVV